MTALLLGLLAASSVGSPAEGALALRDVLLAVEGEHPLLEASRADVGAADGEAMAARGGFDPILRARGAVQPVSGYPQTRLDVVVEQPTPFWGLNLFAGYKLGLGSYPTYDARITNQLGEVRAGLELPVLRNGWMDRRRTAVARTRAGAVAAQASLGQQRLDLARAAAVRYWDWVAAGRRREIASALLSIAKDRDVQLKGRVLAGDIPSFERQDNQRALVQREGNLVLAQRGLEQSAIELSLFLRDERGEPVLASEAWLPRAFPEPEADEQPFTAVSLEEALGRRPDVQRLLAQQSAVEADLAFAQNQVLPALDFGVIYKQDFGPGDEKLAKPEVEVGALFEVPLPNRANRGRRDAAEAASRKIDAQLRFAKDRAAADVRDALSALAGARKRLAATRQELAVARSLEVKERERFDLGDSTLLFVNIREQQSAEAASREVDALVDYHRAVAAWRAAVAQPPLGE